MLTRALRVVSLLALVPPVLLAALVIARHMDMTNSLALEEAALLVSYPGLLLLLVVMLIAVIHLARRRSVAWAVGAVGIALLTGFVMLHAEWGWFLPEFGLEAGLEHALLPAIVPLLTLAYAEYTARHPALTQPAGS